MITVQDHIRVAPGDVARLRQLVTERYLPLARNRGLALVDMLVSPPLALQDAANTFSIRWQVPDAGAWWGVRATATDPAVLAFWAEVDSFCTARERRYFAAADTDLPPPADTAAVEITTRGRRETAQLALQPGLTAAEKTEFSALLQRAAEALPGLEATALGANLAPEYATGDYTWDLLFPDQSAAEAARNSSAWREQVEPLLARYCRACDAAALDTIGAGLRQPGLANGIKRTGYFRLLPGVAPALAARFEHDLLAMPAHIPAILNWRLSRALPLPWRRTEAAPWTWVWEQEFAGLDGLTGPYMAHPHHWAHVDRWFDHESGDRIMDLHLSHAFSPLVASLITLEAAK